MTSEPARVVAIHLAPASRLPTRAVPSVVAEAGVGLIGDRYHGTRHRHISVQAADDLAAASDALGTAIQPGATRRNVTVDRGPIPTTPGTRLHLGDVEVEVVRIAAPCRLLDDGIADGARRALHGRAGSICRILTSGTIAVGDAVHVHVDAAPHPAPAPR